MVDKMAETQYGNESITALKGADRVRRRPGVIFGSDGLEGCQHSVFEIIANSVDEARDGYGKEIIVTRFLDHSIEVHDFGRGIPMDFNPKEKRFNWELVFCELYAGGKFDDDDYGFSLGLNGLGLCATQYSSEYMDVKVVRDGFVYSIDFKQGNPASELKKEKTDSKQTGTTIKWRPDIDVFTDIDVPVEYYQDVIKRQAIVNNGLIFILKTELEDGTFEEEVFLYEDGIKGYVEEIIGEDALTPVQFIEGDAIGKDRADKPEYPVKMSVAFAFTNRHKLCEYYHNSSYLEYGGSPEKAVKLSFVAMIDAHIKDSDKYLKNESKITFQDIEDCLVLVSSSFSTQTSYENQTKKAITNRFIYEAMNDFLRRELEVYFLENPSDADKIAEQVLINKRSRENAEKTRLNIRKKLSGGIDISNRVEKFVDCRTKDVSERELYIVEGDSAMGSVKLARDSNFQAIIPVRGKILNCLKADYNRIFKNDIITDIIKVLGCGVEVKSKANKNLSTFDLDGLRWNKVVICTDADVDGFQIRTLILTMLYRLTPTLITEGFVYIAESPLYEITTKEKTFFAYSDFEKVQLTEDLGDKKYSIQRSKGLGENEPDMMWLTTMNPETRRLIKVTPTDVEETSEMFEVLLGDNLQGRKDFIEKHGQDYLEFADIS